MGMRALWVAAALLFFSLPFEASALRKIDAGSTPVLKPGEGLLVVSADTSSPIDSVRFERDGGGMGSGVLSRLMPGRTVQLYAVPAGKYHWTVVTLMDTYAWKTYYELSTDPEYRFEVKPGQITYAGDLIVRPTSWQSGSIHISNRSLPIIDWLSANHPQLYDRYPFIYSGFYPDPFPEFYRKEFAAATQVPSDLNAGSAAPEPGNLPISAKTMWTPDNVESIALSPDGALVAEVVLEPDRKQALNLIDIAASTSQRIAVSDAGFAELQWESERVLLVSTPLIIGRHLHAFVVGERKGAARDVRRLSGPSNGAIVDLLPDEPAMILYEGRDKRGTLVVHRLGIDTQDAFGSFRNKSNSVRLNRGITNDLGWYADGHGRLRLANAKVGDKVVLMHGLGEEFHPLTGEAAEEGFSASRLSRDGDLIYGLTDHGRAQRDLVVFDPALGKITVTLFSKPGVDVTAPVFNAQGAPIGVNYYDSGRLATEYFDPHEKEVGIRVSAAFPGKSTAVIGRSDDGQRMVIWADASDQPAKLYYLDLAQHEAQLIGEAMPQLATHKFVETQIFSVHRKEGQPIAAFMTLPSATGKRPLVVMAHGGPFGVADNLHFDREVQFLASQGMAVLQVNFRGSEGYGRSFRESARSQLGTGIEDDIDAALQEAIARYPLDPGRICMMGTSYGGYSALVSAIRWPGRFRCVVSISGVSDRALFFTASDGGHSASGRAELERWIGDPRQEMDKMIATSPLYQYRQLSLPVMLVHGREDERVDFEHTRRLVRMLNLSHRTPVVLAFPNEGHGFGNPLVLDIAWTGIAGFLKKNLNEGNAVTEVNVSGK